MHSGGVQLYFAYGSNMYRPQMADRCPGALPVGTASLHGWRFVINQRGVATISEAVGHLVLGVVWMATEKHIEMLDRFEGVHVGNYFRREVDVHRAVGVPGPVVTYVDHRVDNGAPRPGYLERVVAGARSFRMHPEYVAGLEKWSGRTDPRPRQDSNLRRTV